MTNHILYFTHGSEEFLNETYFALLSYFAHHSETENKVVVYTDNIDFFKNKLPQSIEYVSLDKQIITQWKGDINFVHRVKIELLKDFSTKYTGNVLYLDSDTYFKQNINELFNLIENNEFVMSIDEGVISDKSNPIFKKFNTYFTQKKYTLNTTDVIYNISKQVRMYNAGIIGIKIPQNNEVFNQALQITDYIYPEHPSHVVEQFAFSYILQNKNPNITEAEPMIHHYWYFKEFRDIITNFLEKNKGKSFEELVQLSTSLNPERMGSEKLKYKQMNFIQKLVQKLTKFRKWKIVD